MGNIFILNVEQIIWKKERKKRLTSQNCGLYGSIVHTWVIVMWTMVWWYRLVLTPNMSTRALWQPPLFWQSWDISGGSRRMGEGNENLVHSSTGTTSHRKTLLLWNLNRGGQGPIWAVAPLDGWMDGYNDTVLAVAWIRRPHWGYRADIYKARYRSMPRY
jgi:hypothetical protein